MDRPVVETWPVKGATVLVENDSAVRTDLASRIEHSSGFPCHAVESYSLAVSVVRAIPSVRLVILDDILVDEGCETSDLGATVERLRRLRPNLVLVGSSRGHRREDFDRFGVHRFLRKPWRRRDLLRVLPRRIDRCPECDMRLPLRHLQEGETGFPWRCSFCDSRFVAVLDEDTPLAFRRNALRVDDE